MKSRTSKATGKDILTNLLITTPFIMLPLKVLPPDLAMYFYVTYFKTKDLRALTHTCAFFRTNARFISICQNKLMKDLAEIQTLQIPTTRTVKQNLVANPEDPYSHHAIFTTHDNIKICIRFTISFKVDDCNLLISRLGLLGINNHIENLLLIDVAIAFKNITVRDFLTDNHRILQDCINVLREDLKPYGITLIKLVNSKSEIFNPDMKSTIKLKSS